MSFFNIQIPQDLLILYTVDSRYLEVEGTH